jgi:hypothetical protein
MLMRTDYRMHSVYAGLVSIAGEVHYRKYPKITKFNKAIPLERTGQAILSAASRRSCCSGPGMAIPYRTQIRLLHRAAGLLRAFRRVTRVPRALSPPRNDIVTVSSTNDSAPYRLLAMLKCSNQLEKSGSLLG